MNRQMNMNNDIFVGGFDFQVTDSHLQTVFADFGHILKCRIVMDQQTGVSKGFGFVEFQQPEAALNAIKNMNGQEFMGRNLKVNFSQNSHLESLAVKLGMDLSNNKPAYNSKPQSQNYNNSKNMGGNVDAMDNVNRVADAIKSLSKSEIYQILSQLKEVADKDPNAARALLTQHPMLPEAVLHCMSKLEMIKNAVGGNSGGAGVSPELVQQVMSLSEEQISQLPQEKQGGIRGLRAQIMGNR